MKAKASFWWQNATQKSQKVFVHVPSEIAAHEVEEIGMHYISAIAVLDSETVNIEVDFMLVVNFCCIYAYWFLVTNTQEWSTC